MDSEYREAFSNSNSSSTEDGPFLYYYSVQNHTKTLEKHCYHREELLRRAVTAARYLKEKLQISEQDRVCHYFTSNKVEDIVLRLAAVILRCVPVTVNWSTDTTEKVAYKVNDTRCKLLVVDEGVHADTIEEVRKRCPKLLHICNARDICASEGEIRVGSQDAADILKEPVLEIEPVPLGQERIIIFTSGTTSHPKGVRLCYDNYVTNRATFEQFLDVQDTHLLCAVVVNPLHHTNSTSITDWAIRRPKAQLHLFEKYTNRYWDQLHKIADSDGLSSCDARERRIVAPLVSRHFEILENVVNDGKLSVPLPVLRERLSKVDFLVGSAPVGPGTIERIQKFAKKLPLVRFGSTETCLQVLGSPRHLSEDLRTRSFKRGWAHTYKKEPSPGYYIGQAHLGFTKVKVVRSTDQGDSSFLQECEEGEPGLLVAHGRNLMLGYIDDAKTKEVIVSAPDKQGRSERWYLNLGDVCFWLRNPANGEKDIFWQSRDNALLIRGGVNYSYAQINEALIEMATKEYNLGPNDIAIAVVGMRLSSEHDDECLARVELSPSLPHDVKKKIQEDFARASHAADIPKAYKPLHVSFGEIPRNFKGALLVADLKKLWKAILPRQEEH